MRKLISFEGRVTRGQFWGITYGGFILFVLAVLFLVGDTRNLSPVGVYIVDAMRFIVPTLYTIIVVAAIVKRFHDRDKNGLWVLISLTGVGLLWIIIECGFMKGTVGPNKYGEDPVYRKAPVVS